MFFIIQNFSNIIAPIIGGYLIDIFSIRFTLLLVPFSHFVSIFFFAFFYFYFSKKG
jgi:hypothetical protein